MHLNPQEEQLWQTVAPLLAPDGAVDADALSLYLRRTVELLKNEEREENETDCALLGAVLKHTPASIGENAFLAYYKEWRGYGPGYGVEESIDDWFEGMAKFRPHDLQKWLKKASVELPFDYQLLVWRDVGKWLPHANVSEFISKTTLRKNPAVLLKDVEPDLEHVPFLCQVGLELSAAGATKKHRALGDTLTMECFFRMYCTERETSKKPTYAANFNSQKAFALIAGKIPSSGINDFLSALAVRTFHPCAHWDALDFALTALRNKESSPESQAWAQTLVHHVLLQEDGHRQKNRLGHCHMLALAHIYALTEDSPLGQKIVDSLYAYGHDTEAPYLMLDIWSAVVTVSPSLLEQLVQRVQDTMPEHMWETFQQTWFLNAHDTGLDYDFSLSSMKRRPHLQQWFFDRVSSAALLTILHKALATTDLPEDLIVPLSALHWPEEKLRAVRQSTWPIQAVLYMLYDAAQGFAEDPPEDGKVPLSDWHPLPFLRKMYPEHNALWRTLQLEILALPQITNSEHDDVDYVRIMDTMFNTVAKALLISPMSFAQAKSTIEALGVAPQEYFAAQVCPQENPMLALPPDMTSIEMEN